MATLSLKISMDGGKVVKTMQFDPATTVYDACRIIREKILEANAGEPKEYGLFLTSDEDSKKGIWLEPSRSLDYYILRNGDVLEYNKKMRNLRVRMLDGTVKTLLVDDSQIVANLMVVICTKIGITNYDEYGLVREEQKDEPDPCEKPNFGTLTLKRKHQEKERDAKMDQLRKKLRTDDEVNWVEGSKTLREQGVEPAETLLLRRKLFFSDRNVDSRDPVQLNLLYVQARDAILDQTHPVTEQKACEFAGIQCQIQFGDHKEDKHTTGFLDLKEFLPASYVKVKGIEKKVFKEHRRHLGLSELDAKVLYTKSARSLPTYGVAFFLVKEKMKGKNKLVPRLLGVTKDSVLRLDEKTKETLQSWPLTTVRRWCASPNTFTLDFGDYSDHYYSVQTTEAEQILQVIAGYIDIILRKQRARDHLGIEGDEGSAMLEDSVSPSKANIIQHDTFKSGKASTESVAKPAVLRPGAEGAKSFAVGHLTSAQQTTVSGQIITGHAPPTAAQTQQTHVTPLLSEPQRALLSTISSGRELIRRTETHLARAPLPELGGDAASVKWKQSTMDSSKQLVSSQIAAMNAATAQVVTLTAGPTEEVDHTAVGAAITTITSNLPEMSKGVQMIAALLDDSDNGDRLLDATRKLCSAFSDLLKAAEPETKEPRQNLLNAASRVGEASTSVLHTIGEESELDKETQDILLSLAKAVANTTAALVLKAKQAAATCREDPAAQQRIIAAATHCALVTSQLVACAKVVAPTMGSAACRSQLASAARQVAQAVERLLQAAAAASPPADLTAAAHHVTDALEQLLAHCQYERGEGGTGAVESVLAATERLAGAADAGEMLLAARLLGQATAHLISDIKTEAERQPSETQRKLLAAAKLLADATAKMVEAARQCASEPQDRSKQEALVVAAEELRHITADYAHGQDAAGAQTARLRARAGAAAAAARQLSSAAAAAGDYNTNNYSQETLVEECKSLNEQVPRILDAVKVSSLRPSEAAAHLDLIAASEQFLQPSGHVVQAARAALPTVTDAAAARHLADTTHTLTTSCADLRSAVNRARISCKGLELEAAAEIISSLQQQLDEVEEAARAFELRPLPGETAEWAWSSLRSSSRQAASHSAQLVAGARGAEPAGCARAAAALAADLRDWTRSLRAAAAVSDQPAHRERVLSSGRHVLESSLTLVETVKTYLSSSETVDIQHVLTVAKDMSQNLERTMEAVPSHSELESAMETINETLNILNMGEFPPTDRTYSELQSELTSAAAELNARSSELAQAVASPERLGGASGAFAGSFNRLCGAAVEMAGQTENVESRTLMVNSMKTVTVNSSKLLGTAKSVSQDLTRPNAKNELAAAARAVTDSINRLVDVCTSAAPGQKECEAAVRSIQATRPLLDAPSQPLSELGYFACLDAVLAHSKTLSEGMSSMASAVKRSEHEQFARDVHTVAEAVCGLVECTSQAAYLVAVSDESSAAGRPGLVDQAQFARAAVAIEQACRALADTSSHQQQVLSAATVIAKHTSALCNACRVASGKTARAQDKRHFVQAAKDVANCTAALVKEIKALDCDYSEVNRGRCAAATGPLRDAVRSLCQFADSSEFASIPARISPQARRLQEPILLCGRNIISGSCSMIESAQALALAPQDHAQWKELVTHSKSVSDSIKQLVGSIREKAPGQRECGAALETLGRLTRDLDQAAIAAVGQELAPRRLHSLQGYSEQIENSATEILERLDPLRQAAKAEAENLGHAVVQMVSYAEPLVAGCIGAASNITESVTQAELLDRTRTVLETLSALVLAAQHAAGSPRATSAHPEVETQAGLARAALQQLSALGRETSAAHGAVGPLLDAVARCVSRLTDHRMSLIGSYDEADSFVDYQTRMVGAAKDIARLATDMTAKSATDASRLVQLGNELCQAYERLAGDSVGAAATTPNADVAARIRSAVVELGEEVSELIRAGGHCRLSATAPHQRAVAAHAKLTNDKVVAVLGALQAGSRGTQACIDAAATIASILGDLDTTILFASAGTLHPEKEGDSFSEHREGILKTAKTLVEDTKSLVGGAAGTQDQLAAAAASSVATIVQLCEVVKQGAVSLGAAGADSQVLLLHAARDVAAALRSLAAATAAASGKPVAHPDMERLKHAAKCVTGVTRRWSTAPRRPPRVDVSGDSETDVYQSDLEDELVRLLDYSSQDDDVSPSIFHDSCEEIITYVESFIRRAPAREPKNDDLNGRYNIVAKNSLVDMDWRVLKYGEILLLSEVKNLVDLVVEIFDKMENKRKREKIAKLKASSELDNEMKRLSQVIEDIDSEMEIEEINSEKEIEVKKVTTTTTFTNKRGKVDEKVLKHRLKNPSFKIKKVKPVNLVINLDLSKKSSETKFIEPAVKKEVSPQETNKDECTVIDVKPSVIERNTKADFWTMFKDDTEWWKALAKRNLQKMEETRKDLERFSGHELVLGEIQNEMNEFNKDKETLQNFIDEIDKSQSVNKDLEYDKKYEDMVLKLINFAKKDFNYKGFDPLIDQLRALSNVQIEGRKNKIISIQDVMKMYSEIDITKYTYEELCILEKHYKEIIRKIKKDYRQNNLNENEKENVVPREERSPILEQPVSSPSYHKNVLLNIHSSQNVTKNINQYTSISNSNSLKRSKKNQTENNVEIFDLTRTYPMEYYANNWWSIYEDILKNREQQFGSIDNWWRFYEAILDKQPPADPELSRIRAAVQHRAAIQRPRSRLLEQLRELDQIDNRRFTETEDVTTADAESVMVTNVTSLLKTVKAVEDEHTRGTRALESTIEAITQEMAVLTSPAAPKSTATAEELIRHTRQMTAATARAVAAGNSGSQDQLTAAANLGRKTVIDLLIACKGAAAGAECAEHGARTLAAGAGAAAAYRALLAAVLAGDATELPARSRDVARAVADLIAAADLLKGSDWVDPNDPTVIAENELLGAAASIDAAAKKLESLRPRKSVKVQEADETLNFDEMILEAARSIITATSALVRAASAAQRELIDQGKVARRPASSSDDGQWSEGLVSAARLVAAAAHALVEAANALVQGAGSEERLISSARHVASSTAQLLVACKVKADPSSESTRRLQAAGAEVIRSTDNLVRAARDAIQCEEERSLVLNRRMVGGIAQEIDARSEVLRIERELEEARGRLNAIRQAKYKLRADQSGDETDAEPVTPRADGPAAHRLKSPTSSFANTTYSPNSSYTPNHSQTSTNLSHHVTQLNQSVGSAQHNGAPPPPRTSLEGASFSSFRPQDVSPKQNYEGFTTREDSASHDDRTMSNDEQARPLAPKEVRSARLVAGPPPPPPRRLDARNYETRLYDTPRPLNEFSKIEEKKHFESNQYQFSKQEQKYGYDTNKVSSPMSPTFNARELKFEEKSEPIYSTLNKHGIPKSPFDGIGQNFTEHQRSTEIIPGGTKQSEFTIKSESYQSFPKSEYSMSERLHEVKLPIATSTPTKYEKSDFFSQHEQMNKSELGPVAGGPDYLQESSTEVREVPHGTQKITTTKIYSSSPLSLTSSFMRPSAFRHDGVQAETLERKSVTTSSLRSETSSTTTKKFSNY